MSILLVVVTHNVKDNAATHVVALIVVGGWSRSGVRSFKVCYGFGRLCWFDNVRIVFVLDGGTRMIMTIRCRLLYS